jgi:hypothetical protein
MRIYRPDALLPGRWARFEGWLYLTSFLYLGVGVCLLVSGLWRLKPGRIAVGALALLLFPVWRFCWDSGASVRCSSNLGGLRTGFAVYQMWHDGRFPDARKWADEIYPYIGPTRHWGLFKCPGDLSTARCSYAFNSRLSGKRLSDIADRSRTVLLYETTAPGDNPSGTGATMLRRPRHRLSQPGCKVRFNNFLFASGALNPEHPVKWHW